MKHIDSIKNIGKECDSFYIYYEEDILSSIERLKSNFPSVKFLYSLKTNPNPKLLDLIYGQGIGADAASLEEVKMSKIRGVKIQDLQFSTPGKSKYDIEKSLKKSTIIADSLNEIKMISEVAVEKKYEAKIGVRLNPNFTLYTDQGAPGKFGVDENLFLEKLDELKELPNIKIVGIHVHSKSQELDYKVLENYYKNLIDLAKIVNEKLEGGLEFLNMGSGIGIPFEEDWNEVNVEELGKSLEGFLEEAKEELGHVQFYIESGRYISGKVGYYISKVRDKKESYGKKFVLLSNTLNGYFRAAINQMMKLYIEDDTKAPMCEPVYTSLNSTQFWPLEEREEKETVTISGNLCTAADIIAKDLEFPKLEIGDLVVFNNAGAYSIVLTPIQFASLEKPKEFLIKKNGKIEKAK